MKAIIIDDEKHAIMALKGLLNKHFKQIEIVAVASQLKEGADLINQHHPELVFLDISMPLHSGFEINQFITDSTPEFHTVFVTGHKNYALKAYEHNATDYLLKPVQVSDIERLFRKINLLSPQL